MRSTNSAGSRSSDMVAGGVYRKGERKGKKKEGKTGVQPTARVNWLCCAPPLLVLLLVQLFLQ